MKNGDIQCSISQPDWADQRMLCIQAGGKPIWLGAYKCAVFAACIAQINAFGKTYVPKERKAKDESIVTIGNGHVSEVDAARARLAELEAAEAKARKVKPARLVPAATLVNAEPTVSVEQFNSMSAALTAQSAQIAALLAKRNVKVKASAKK